jgi:hypothetical protein
MTIIHRTALPNLGLLALLFLLPGLALAQTPAAAPPAAPAKAGTPSNGKGGQALMVVNARSAQLDGNTLTLQGIAPSTILFANRPVRRAGYVATGKLIDEWNGGKTFAKDPPNATISAFSKDGTVSDAVVVLRSPKLDGENLTFNVTVLEGSLGEAKGAASLFIDTIWFGVGSNGFTYLGHNQTTSGETPAFGSRDDTSTTSGWSNPAPDGRPQPSTSPLQDPSLAVPPGASQRP